MQQGEMKELQIIVKADVQGSVEAVRQSLEKLSNDEVRVKVIHGGVGAINESDVMLANASNAIIVGFNVRPDPVAEDNAKRSGCLLYTWGEDRHRGIQRRSGEIYRFCTLPSDGPFRCHGGGRFARLPCHGAGQPALFGDWQ